MIRLLRTEKQHWPGPGTTRGEVGLREIPSHTTTPSTSVPTDSARDIIPRLREAMEPPGE